MIDGLWGEDLYCEDNNSRAIPSEIMIPENNRPWNQ